MKVGLEAIEWRVKRTGRRSFDGEMVEKLNILIFIYFEYGRSEVVRADTLLTLTKILFDIALQSVNRYYFKKKLSLKARSEAIEWRVERTSRIQFDGELSVMRKAGFPMSKSY